MVNIDLSSKRIRELRESNLTVADLRQQIGLKRIRPSMNGIKTRKQIRNLGRAVQKQVDKSTPGGRRGREIKQTKLRKKPTD